MQKEDIERVLNEHKPVAYVEVEGGAKGLLRDVGEYLLWGILIGVVWLFTAWWFDLI